MYLLNPREMCRLYTTHYTPKKFGNDLGPTYNYLYPEAQIGGGHYLMMEIDLAHRCGETHCSDSGITCHNDGYLSLVDGRCGCKCSFPGLDPHTGCQTPITSSTPTQAWPTGSYALPQPKEGCADDGRFASGSRVHHTGAGNKVSKEFDMAGGIYNESADQRFCVSEGGSSQSADDVWPAGSYCIYRKGGSCPDHFNEAYVQYVYSGEYQNSQEGSLPDGEFGANTRLEFCCRNDGFGWEPLFLPNRKPFVLIRTENKDCQQVRGMHVYKQYYEIAHSPQGGINASFGGNDQFGVENNPITKSFGRYTTTLC